MFRWSLPLLLAVFGCNDTDPGTDDTGTPVIDDSSTPKDDTATNDDSTPPDDSDTDDTGTIPIDTAHQAPDTVEDYAVTAWYGDFGDRAGGTVTPVGDISGDGTADLLIGAPLSDAGGAGDLIGRGYIVTPDGGTDEVELDSVPWITGTFLHAHLSWDAGRQIDVNNDGQDDLLVGTFWSAETGALDGSGDLYLGPVTDDPPKYPDVRLRCDEPHATAGLSIESLGDVTADGEDDFAVGSPGSGTVYVVAGNDDWGKGGLLTDIGTRVYGPGSYLGEALLAGDWTGDGVADLTASTSEILDGPATVYVFEGPIGTGDLLSDDASLMIQPTTLVMTATLANAGDTDGDGTNDLAIGLPNDDGGHGAVHIYTSPLGAKPTATFAADLSIGQLGWSMDGVGDTNDDGFDDFAMGAPSPLYGDHRGTLVVQNGPFSGTTTVVASIWIGDTGYDELGWSVAGLGDVNGDGNVDVAVGAPEFGQDAGAVYLLSDW
jgi:hypothetical protein